MSRSESGRNYTPALLLVLLATQFFLMTYTARIVSPVDGTEQTFLHAWVYTIVTPVQGVLSSAFSGVGSLWNGYVDLRGVRERNAELELENATMRAEIESARTAVAENDRLRADLNLRPRLKYKSVTAEVIARGANAWHKNLTINKGSKDGIGLNQPVVTPQGLVGRVVAIGLNAAKIQLVTDEHAGVGGRLITSRTAVEVKGRGDGMCRFKNISSLQDMPPNEAVITSGLDRIYPAGILVGYVSTDPNDAGASAFDVTVRPAAALDRIEEVMVLLVPLEDVSTPQAIK
jgi:rod shape-determining protein MreC